MRCPCGGSTVLVPVPTCPACGEQWIGEAIAKELDAAVEPSVIESRRKRILLRRVAKAIMGPLRVAPEFCTKCGAEGSEPHRGECLPSDSREDSGIGEGSL